MWSNTQSNCVKLMVTDKECDTLFDRRVREDLSESFVCPMLSLKGVIKKPTG